MKHLILGTSILLVILAVCILCISLLDHYAGQTVDQLELAQSAMNAEKPDEAAQYADGAAELWQKHAGFLGSILCHEEADEINRHLARLLANADAGDTDEFRATCAELMVLVSHLPHMERAMYYNIL